VFDEVTYSNGEDEVMVHFDTSNPRVPTTVYCYSDSWLVNPPTGTDGLEKDLTWTAEPRNSLFFNASDPVKALRQIKRHGYVRCPNG